MSNVFDLGATNVALALDCPFPANVNSGPGIGLVKAGGTWSLSLDTMSLAENTVPVPGNLYGAYYDTALARYERVRVDNLIAAATGLDTRQPIVDANYSVTTHDRYVALTMALTAPRIVTLPPANNVPGGREVMLEDEVGGLSSVNYFNVQPTGTDTINGAASYVMGTPYGGARFRSDGTGRWSVVNTSNFYLVPAGATTYTASPDGNVVAWPAFTAPVVTTLPAAAAYQKGRRITIADRNGSCTTTNTMKVQPAGTDTINGSAAPGIATMNAAYSAITLFSDGVSAWTVAGGGNITAGVTVVSTQISDSSALGRQLLTNAGAPADRTALGSGAVGDAVFVSATAGAAQSALGLGTMATQAANGVSITGGTIAGVAVSGGTVTNATITSGHMDGTVIGATTPAAATVTSMNGGPLAGQRNMFINGDMRIDQRNNGAATPALNGAVYTIDRWIVACSPGTPSMQAQQVIVAPSASPGSPWTLQITTTTAHPTTAAGDVFIVDQRIEGLNCAHLGWGTANAKPITVSGTVVSSYTGNTTLSVRNGASNRSYTVLIPVSNGETPFAVTIPGDTAGTWAADNTTGLDIGFDMGSGSTYTSPANGVWAAGNFVRGPGSSNLVATAGYIPLRLRDAQVEMGIVATPFERRLIGTEMVNCQRYYERIYGQGRFTATGAGTPYDSPVFFIPKRASPTFNLVTAGTRVNLQGGGTAMYGSGGPNGARFEFSSAAAGDTYALNDLWEVVAEL